MPLPPPREKPPETPGIPADGKPSQEYWENKSRLDFQRSARMASLKAAAMVIEATLTSGNEKMTLKESTEALISLQERIYQSLFQGLEMSANEVPF